MYNANQTTETLFFSQKRAIKAQKPAKIDFFHIRIVWLIKIV